MPLDGMCCEEPPVPTGQADGTDWEEPSSVSTAIPSLDTLGRAGDTHQGRRQHVMRAE